MLAEIMPAMVAVAEAFTDAADIALFPEEEAAIGRAVSKRRREFTAVRGCARTALALLGQPPAPIVPGLNGAPQWPHGLVGSMTHCAGYRACAIARAADVVTLGLDAEPAGPLPDGVLKLVSLAEERAMLSELATDAYGESWDKLLFCAKESVYKAWFPLAQRWLGFEQVRIVIDPHHKTFTARLLVDGPLVDGHPLTGFSGNWLIHNGLVVTAIAALVRPSAPLG